MNLYDVLFEGKDAAVERDQSDAAEIEKLRQEIERRERLLEAVKQRADRLEVDAEQKVERIRALTGTLRSKQRDIDLLHKAIKDSERLRLEAVADANEWRRRYEEARGGQRREQDDGPRGNFNTGGGPGVGFNSVFEQFFRNHRSVFDPFADQQRFHRKPPPPSTPTWATILGVSRTCTREQLQAAYRRAAKKAHPDAGGTEQEFINVRAAYDEAMRARGFGGK